ncbi:MAG: septum formation initiator family protein [Eubacteriales bacterium]|nr:septum formation initiator family protein [Eubacteriales bacterium]
MAKKRRYRGSNRRGMLCISAIVMILLSVMFAQSNHLRDRNAAYAAEVESLNEKIDQEHQRSEEIARLQEYIRTPEYAGERARENLGLVAEDEILFRAKN